MATFFDASESVDKALLHSSVRTHSEAATVAQEVEDDIVEHFTADGILRGAVQDTNDGPYWYTENDQDFTVQLWGYNPTLASAAGYDAERGGWTGFAKAMREAIALVTSHRLRHYDDDLGVESESHGRESWSYRKDRDTKWPSGWKRSLKRYITKPKTWAV